MKGDGDYGDGVGDGDAGGGSSGSNSIGIVAGVVGAAVVVLGALYITMKRRRYAEPHVIEKTRSDGSALHLDADGDVLSQAMTPNSTTESPRSFGEGGEDGDDMEVTDVI
jgi:fructose-1,6-bisphosphatase/sedoheptulose 1,7-bisphosphatase-like protein